MSSNILLSIIILSYNTRKITLDCLRSIFKDKGLTFDPNDKNDRILTEVIVIDNASTDDSLAHLKKIKNIKLIKNRQNLGFAKANNQGIKKSRGNFILFLNSDTLILHSAISQSLNWLSAHPEAHMCTAQLLNRDHSIQPSGGFFPNLANVFTWSTGLDDLPFVNSLVKAFHPHPPQFYTREKLFLTDHPQDWLTGAFILIRTSAVRKTGGFDATYFMYGEEMEWAYRLRLVFPDSQAWYLVGPQIIHLGGASAKNKSDPLLQEYLGVISFLKNTAPPGNYPYFGLF